MYDPGLNPGGANVTRDFTGIAEDMYMAIEITVSLIFFKKFEFGLHSLMYEIVLILKNLEVKEQNL